MPKFSNIQSKIDNPGVEIVDFDSFDMSDESDYELEIDTTPVDTSKVIAEKPLSTEPVKPKKVSKKKKEVVGVPNAPRNQEFIDSDNFLQDSLLAEINNTRGKPKGIVEICTTEAKKALENNPNLNTQEQPPKNQVNIKQIISSITDPEELAEVLEELENRDDEDEEDTTEVNPEYKFSTKHVLGETAEEAPESETIENIPDITKVESVNKNSTNDIPMSSVTVPQEVIDRVNESRHIISKGKPNEPNWDHIRKRAKELGISEEDCYIKIWCIDTIKNEDSKWKELREQAELAFVSKYQCTDETEQTGFYLPLNDPQFKSDNGIPDNISKGALEAYYDVAYDQVQARIRRQSLNERLDERYKKVVDKTVQSTIANNQKALKKLAKEQAEDRVASDVDAGDKRTLRNNKQEKIDAIRDGIKLDSDDEDGKQCEIHFWDAGMEALDDYYRGNLEVVYSGGGRFGGIEFGIKTRFPHTKGVDNDGLYFYKSMVYVDRKMIMILNGLPGDARAFWLALFNGSPKQSRIAKFAPFVEELRNYKTHSITGKKLAWKAVPPLEAFDPEVQKIDPYDLLSLLPRAEANSFLIHLGRTAFGYNRTVTVDNVPYTGCKVLESDDNPFYRWAMVLHGDANIGKSRLLELVFEALNTAGYSTRALSITLNQFGFEPFGYADAVGIDDTVDRDVIKILSNGKIKTGISNNVQDVESKNVDGKETLSRAALYMAANNLVFPQRFDPGVADRFHFLQVHSEHQMNEMSAKRNRNMYPVAFWESEAERLNVSMKCIGLYLIRCGIKEYLDRAGMVENEDGTLSISAETKKGKPGLQLHLEANRKLYAFQPPIEEKRYICAMARRAYAITDYLEPDFKDQMSFEYDQSFHGFTLLNVAGVVTKLYFERQEALSKIPKIKEWGGSEEKMQWERDKAANFQRILDWIDPKRMIDVAVWLQLRTYWQGKSRNGQAMGDTKTFTFEQIWKELSTLVTTFDGRPIEPVRFEWTAAFQAAKANLGGYASELRVILDDFCEKMTKEEYSNFKRVATRFAFPATKITAGDAFHDDVADIADH